MYRKIVWDLRYWDSGGTKSPIERWLNKLPEEQLIAITDELLLLADIGNELTLPHSKPLGKGLFELREQKFGLRIYYCFQGNKIIILLAAGNKRTQDKDIKIARERLRKS